MAKCLELIIIKISTTFFSFESNVIIKYEISVLRSFKQIGQSVAEVIIGMSKSLFFSLHNHRAVRKIVRNKTYDITVSELKKCRKLETVLVWSLLWISEENQLKVFWVAITSTNNLALSTLIFSAYLKGLSKYRRMAFFFLKYLFSFFRDIDVFLLCKLDQWWHHIVCN